MSGAPVSDVKKKTNFLVLEMVFFLLVEIRIIKLFAKRK